LLRNARQRYSEAAKKAFGGHATDVYGIQSTKTLEIHDLSLFRTTDRYAQIPAEDNASHNGEEHEGLANWRARGVGRGGEVVMLAFHQSGREKRGLSG